MHSLFSTASSLRFLLLASCLLIAFTSGFTQNLEEDVIYLKDGGIIRGKIKAQIIDKHVKIEILGGSLFVFEQDEIIKITREPVRQSSLTFVPKRISRKLKPFTYREKGLYNLISFGLDGGVGTWGFNVNPSLTYRVGWSFNQYLNVGAGIGINGYEQGSIVPAFVDIRGDLSQKRLSPMYYLNAGWGVGSMRGWNTQRLDPGAFGEAGLGYKLNTRNRTEWAFSLGYRLQQAEVEFRPWWGGNNEIIEGSLLYRRVVFSTTFGF